MPVMITGIFRFGGRYLPSNRGMQIRLNVPPPPGVIFSVGVAALLRRSGFVKPLVTVFLKAHTILEVDSDHHGRRVLFFPEERRMASIPNLL